MPYIRSKGKENDVEVRAKGIIHLHHEIEKGEGIHTAKPTTHPGPRTICSPRHLFFFFSLISLGGASHLRFSKLEVECDVKRRYFAGQLVTHSIV